METGESTLLLPEATTQIASVDFSMPVNVDASREEFFRFEVPRIEDKPLHLS